MCLELNEKKKKSVKLPSDRARRAKEHCSCLLRPTPPETRCRCCQHQSLSSCPSEPDEIRFDFTAHLSDTYEHLMKRMCFFLCADAAESAGEVVTFHCTLNLTGFNSDTSQSRYSAACIICAIIRSTSLKEKKYTRKTSSHFPVQTHVMKL